MERDLKTYTLDLFSKSVGWDSVEGDLTKTLRGGLDMDDLDITLLILDAEDDLGIVVSEEEEDQLFGAVATVQTAIDIITASYRRGHS